MKIDKKALQESVTDTILGAAFNFPLSWACIAVTLLFTQNALTITVIQLSSSNYKKILHTLILPK